MSTKIEIKGFKCYRDFQLELHQLTILTGANSIGKSTLMEAIVLSNTIAKISRSNELTPIAIQLNAGMDLGAVDGIFYNDGKIEDSQSADTISIVCGGEKSSISLNDNNIEGVHNPAVVMVKRLGKKSINSIHYISACRLGPQWTYSFDTANREVCESDGRNVAQILYINSKRLIPAERTYKGEQPTMLIDAVNDWISHLFFRGMKIGVHPEGSREIGITFTSENYKKSLFPTSVGYALTYSLPIIVSALMACTGDVLIIENPEAHLQPAAQVAMGYFLSRIADAGNQVLVETHSEHVLEGVYLKIDTFSKLNEDNIAIYYFRKNADTKEVEAPRISRSDVEDRRYDDDFFSNPKQQINDYLDFL